MWQPGARNSLADVAGVAVGHAQSADAKTGVTVVRFAAPARASVSIIGQAPGTREAALLDPARTVEQIDGLVLAGGSAFGLAAADAVMTALAEAGRGFRVGSARVPIVPAAILFDLTNGGAKPSDLGSLYRELGAAASQRNADHDQLGAVGAGAGATTGAGPGGLGTASTLFGEDAPEALRNHLVAALVAVNAVGNPYIGDGPHFRAAMFEVGQEFGGFGLPPSVPSPGQNLRMKTRTQPGQNTTIGCLVTTAPLSKAACHGIAVAGQDGIAQAVFPAHTALDGDLVFGVSVGDGAQTIDPAGMTILQAAATATMARAAARGVYAATQAQADQRT